MRDHAHLTSYRQSSITAVLRFLPLLNQRRRWQILRLVETAHGLVMPRKGSLQVITQGISGRSLQILLKSILRKKKYVLVKNYILVLVIKSPTIPTYRQKEEKGKNSRRLQQGQSSLGQYKSVGPALETCQSHTVEHRVSKIVPEGHCEGNKSLAILRDSASRRRISIPTCYQSTACNPHCHALFRQNTIKRVHRVTPDLIQHTLD